MLIEGIDHIGLSLFNELKDKEHGNPDYIYFFNYFNVGVEIIRSSFSVVRNCVEARSYYYHVVCYNWHPDWRIIKDVYKFDYQNFKSDKWNRRFTIGDFSDLDKAKNCFNLVVKCFINEQIGVLF